MPMQNVEGSDNSAVNNVGLSGLFSFNAKTTPLSDITNQATTQPRNGSKKKWSKLEREVGENNDSTDMEVQENRRPVVELSKQSFQKKKQVCAVGGFYSENIQVNVGCQHH